MTNTMRLVVARHIVRHSLPFPRHINSGGRLRPMSSYPVVDFVPTCDLYDHYLDQARVPTVTWHSYGGRTHFCGAAVTIKCHEDNSRLKELTEQAGHDRVLVVDGGASMRCALMGEMLAEAAVAHGWAGVVVYGCVRDVKQLSQLHLGVVALGTTPRKSTRRGEGQVDLVVKIGDVDVHPGDYVYVDSNGVLVLNPKLVHV